MATNTIDFERVKRGSGLKENDGEPRNFSTDFPSLKGKVSDEEWQARVDLAAAYDLSSHWALTARMTNLLNRHYQNPDAFDQPTLGAFAGIKAKF